MKRYESHGQLGHDPKVKLILADIYAYFLLETMITAIESVTT